MVRFSRVRSQEALQTMEKALHFILSVTRRCHGRLRKQGSNTMGMNEDPHDVRRRRNCRETSTKARTPIRLLRLTWVAWVGVVAMEKGARDRIQNLGRSSAARTCQDGLDLGVGRKREGSKVAPEFSA